MVTPSDLSICQKGEGGRKEIEKDTQKGQRKKKENLDGGGLSQDLNLDLLAVNNVDGADDRLEDQANTLAVVY